MMTIRLELMVRSPKLSSDDFVQFCKKSEARLPDKQNLVNNNKSSELRRKDVKKNLSIKD